MRPGQSVNTPDGPGVVLHPVYPGHPEKAWWILFDRFAESFEVNEVEELRSTVNVNTEECV
jgi:hypothetical protein